MHKSLGNAIEPEEVIKHYGAEILRLWVASVEFNEDVRALRHHPHAAHRGLSQAAQHLPLCARQHLAISIPQTDAVPAGDTARDRPVDPGPRRRSGRALPRLVRRVRVPQGLSRDLRFRHGRPERHLLRRAERPAVHVGHAVAGAPQRADRAPPAGLCAGAPVAPHPGLHHGRGLDAHGPAGQRAYRRCFPSRRS